jgi:uncharacterized membrane protein YecN with MAPEG domain
MPVLHTPTVTLLAAGLLGLVFVVLSARVVMGRNSGKVLLGHGQGEAGPLFVAIRAHANFAEYVPLCLVLIGLLELRAGPTLGIKVLALALVLARVSHAVGMGIPKVNPYRVAGFAVTVLVLVLASLSAVLGAL